MVWGGYLVCLCVRVYYFLKFFFEEFAVKFELIMMIKKSNLTFLTNKNKIKVTKMLKHDYIQKVYIA